jgi:glycosyltransferase involved in cell wall biosynthesis
MPRVAVVIPTRNRPHLLGDAVGSAVGQDFRDLEVIVVDDASDDPEANAAIVERFGPPVRYVWRATPGGPSAARNTGIRASTAPLVAFLDDDDLWLPSKVRRQVALFEGPDGAALGAVYCGHQWVDLARGRFRPPRRPRMRTVTDLVRARYNIIQTVMAPRAVLDDVGGFDEALPFQENLDLLMRIAHRRPLAGVDEVLVLCRTHSGPRTGDRLPPIICGYERVIQRAEALAVPPHALAEEYYRLARLHMAVGAMAQARAALRRALAAAPAAARAKYRFFLALSYAARSVRPSLRGALPGDVKPVWRM